MIDPEHDEPIVLECRVVRRVKIIQPSRGKGTPLCGELLVALGNMTRSAEFTLSDREHVKYPVLIGRNILMDSMTVDVSKKFLSVPIPRAKRMMLMPRILFYSVIAALFVLGWLDVGPHAQTHVPLLPGEQARMAGRSEDQFYGSRWSGPSQP